MRFAKATSAKLIPGTILAEWGIVDQDLDLSLEAIKAAVETRNNEFKSGETYSKLRWKLAKTCMAMANLRDGGRILIGMAEREGRWFPDGVSQPVAAEYTQDDVQLLVNRYARPPVQLKVRHIEHEGKTFVAIEVEPFDRTFIFCGNATPNESGKDGLSIGDIPARTRDRISTTKIHDATLVAEIIEIAAEKRAREIITTAQRIGLRLPDDAAEIMRGQRREFSADFE